MKKIREWLCQKCGYGCVVFMIERAVVERYGHKFQRNVVRETRNPLYITIFTFF
jgi:hypothetical protein